MSTTEEKMQEKLKRRETFLHDTMKMFKPEGKATTIRFVGFLGKDEKHVNPVSIGGPCNRSNVIKIPATKETEAFFAKEMAKAQHNKMVMDRHGLKPEDMFDEEKLKKHGITTVQNI